MRRRTSTFRARRAATIAIAAAVAGACSCSTSHAANFSWTNPAGGLFGVSGNWNPLGPPGPADFTIFNLANTYTVTFATSPSNQQFQIGDGNVTFNVDGQTYSLAAGAFVGTLAGTAPRLTLLNGTILSAAGLTIAPNIGIGGNAGTFTIGANAQFTSNNAFIIGVGQFGAGALLVQNGGGLTSGGPLQVASNPAGIGTVSISGASSTIACIGVDLGTSGAANLSITAGGVLTCTQPGVLGTMAGSSTLATAQATISGFGSTWNNAGSLSIGQFGAATVAVSGGGHFITGGRVTFGDIAAASGTASVSGVGSVWDAPTSLLLIGNGGRGEVDIASGGVLNSGSIIMAAAGSAAPAIATVAGSGSAWNCASMLIGSIGNASLTVSSGGAVNSTGNININDPSGAPIGVLTLDGGTVTCGSFLRTGTFNFNDGTLIVRGGPYTHGLAPSTLLVDGDTPDANPTLVLTGGASASNVANLLIGNARRGSLVITDRSTLTVGSISVGSLAGSAGTITVGGGGFSSLTANGTFTLGFSGVGSLIINPNGIVNANNGLTIGDGSTVRLNGGSLAIGTALSVFVGSKPDQFQWNSGTVLLNVTATLPGSFMDLLLGSQHTLGPGQAFSNTGSFTLGFDSPLTINGGLLGSNFVGSGSFSNQSDMLITSGGISTQGNLTNFAGGIITITGNGTIGLSGGTSSFANSGTVQLASTTCLIKSNSGSMSNNGTLRGTGNVNLAFINSAIGQVVIGNGERMDFSGGQGAGSFTNNGLVSVIHGEGVFNATFNNNATGAIAGHDSTLRFNAGLVNGGSLLFTSGQSDIFGAIANNSGGKIIVSGAGTATFYNPITHNSGAELRVSTGATGIFFGAVNGSGLISGSGLKIFEGGMSSMGPLATQTGSSLVESSASITADNVQENALTLFGQFTVRPNGTNTGTSRLNSLLVDAGTFDLNDNDLVVDYTGTSPFNSIRGYITTGGVRSSLATTTRKLGIAENSVLGLATFSGQPVDSTSILIKYTYSGDANLDGQVDVTDLGALATNWQTSAPWTGGDFNYDGFVDVTDLGALATNWQAGVGSPLAPSRLDEALAAVGLAGTNVPESSTTAAILMLGNILLVTSRLRRTRLV